MVLRARDRIAVEATIGRIDRAGLAFFPDGGRWPSAVDIEAERAALLQRHRERRAAPRLPIPSVGAGASGTAHAAPRHQRDRPRYALTSYESAPAVGSRIEGALQIDAVTAIESRPGGPARGARHRRGIRSAGARSGGAGSAQAEVLSGVGVGNESP